MGVRNVIASVSDQCSRAAVSVCREVDKQVKAIMPHGKLACAEAALVAGGTYLALQRHPAAVLSGASLGLFSHSLGLNSPVRSEKAERQSQIQKIALAPVGALLIHRQVETYFPGFGFAFRAMQIVDKALGGLAQRVTSLPNPKEAALNEKLATLRDVVLMIGGALAYQSYPDATLWGMGAAAAASTLHQYLHPAPQAKEKPNRIEIFGTVAFAAMGAAALRWPLYQGKYADRADYFLPRALGVGAFAAFNKLLHQYGG